jgi:uncharacterized protein (TIGR03083 family)
MARNTFTKDMWLDALRVDGQAFRAAVGEADLGADVPSCPGWTVADLVGHLDHVYRSVSTHIVRAVTTPPERPVRANFADEPLAADLLSSWDEQFAKLVSTLEVVDPELPAWNWAPQVKRAGFWHRRMAHETSIHRWDAQIAIGLGEPIDSRLAADGVAEVLETYLPARRRREPASLTGLATLHATDLDQNWFVRLRGEGIALLDTDTIFDDDEHRPSVTAAGSASDLDLALWGRIGADVLDIAGDEAMLDALRASA